MRHQAVIGAVCFVFSVFCVGACNVAYSQELSTEPVISECNAYSDGAPDECVCLAEDRVLDAAAELKACRDKPVISFDQMTWLERGLWLAVAALGVVFL